MQGELSASRGSLSAPSRNEVTDIIPFNEFGMLDDLDFSANSHFDKEAQVLRAPELDGMLEGGVPILVEGQVVGAVGVSGVKSAEDAQIAKAGIAALGL